MMSATKTLTLSLVILVIWLNPTFLQAQESKKFDEQTKLIRIKKIANEWQGTILTLTTREGDEIHGKLVEVSAGKYHMEVGAIVIQIPLEDVVRVSFLPGPPEMFLAITSSLMGGAFLGGAFMISKDDASSEDIGTAALLGIVAGGLWGYSTFYESEIIELE
ncbi:hypothetical protein HQ531_12335 [bacterium]|nr:hypothetical protein [bacterium]